MPATGFKDALKQLAGDLKQSRETNATTKSAAATGNATYGTSSVKPKTDAAMAKRIKESKIASKLSPQELALEHLRAYGGAAPLDQAKRRALVTGSQVRGARVAEVQDTARKREDDRDARARFQDLALGGAAPLLVERDGDQVAARRADLPARDMKALRTLAVDSELDLHGLTTEVALTQLKRFLDASYRNGAQVVRVIFGKGLHSPGGIATLRDVVIQALTAGDSSKYVRACITPSDAGGGSGALAVLLRRRS